jgi:threonine dehydrogenase-like Zn-dependent dehydrogenase
MKAVVYYENTRVEFVRDRPAPLPRSADDTLVKVLACGLCGSDMRIMTVPQQMPCVPNTAFGHELIGRVETPAIGSEFEYGDLVVAVPNLPCHTCYQCKRGVMNLCENFTHVGTHMDGGLAEEIWLPSEALHKVPAGLNAETAALTEPLACVLNATNRLTWNAGQPVVILGAGPIGLLFTAVAKLSGAYPLVVSEPNVARAELARQVGADYVVDPLTPGAEAHIAELVGASGSPTVIDALGTLLPTALSLASRGGEVILFGVNHAAEVTISPADIVDKDLTIHGVYIHKGTFDLALRLLAQHPELFSKIITHRIPIEEWETAKLLLMNGTAAGKILVTMGTW